MPCTNPDVIGRKEEDELKSRLPLEYFCDKKWNNDNACFDCIDND